MKHLTFANIFTAFMLAVIAAFFLSATVFNAPVQAYLKKQEDASIQKYCTTDGRMDIGKKSCNDWILGNNQD